MPYFVGKFVDTIDSLVKLTPETFKSKRDITVWIRHEVQEIDLARRRLHVVDIQAGRERWEPFDRLVIATGALPIRPPVRGIATPGVFGINTLDDGIALREALDKKRPRKVVIVGGGYIGLETAEAMVMRDLDVTLIDLLPQVMGTLDIDMAAPVAEALRKEGVNVYLEEKLEAFEAAKGRLTGVKTDKRTIPADLAILGLGVRPNTALAEAAGLELGVKKSIKVDNGLMTDHEGVWAVGDCAECFHLVSRRPFWVALATVANKHGRIAGINVGGGDATFPGIVGTAVTKFCETEIARTGLQERELVELGLDYAVAEITGRTRAGYYPGTGPITIKIYAEKGSGRLLGAQIVGTEGSAKRIDVFAAALHMGLTAEDVVGLDLGYAPPYSGAWDPIHIAARQVLKQV